jgi:two-component system response regulator FixJ
MIESRDRVLIVDDELFFREAIGEILVEAGFRIGLAEDGQSALSSVEDQSYGAVVLDVRLPDIDGIAVLARIAEARPDLPVIMLSSSTDQEIVLEALRLGAKDYLAKPLHDEELVLAVGRALKDHQVSAERSRLQGRIDRLVAAMERLSQIVRLAAPTERVSILRQGIVDAASDVLKTERVSLMLADADQEWLSVAATRGVDLDIDAMSPRKVGEGASGICYAEETVVCVSGDGHEGSGSDSSVGTYRAGGFAMVPLVCLGVPVGVLCATHGQEDGDLFLEEPNVLRLLGMQISEFLAADPDVEAILASAAVVDVEGLDPGATGVMVGIVAEGVDALGRAPLDRDAELARLVCEAVAAETEPQRMLDRALTAVARELRAAPVSVFLLSPDAKRLDREAEVDAGLVGDRESLPATDGLTGMACQTGQLVAFEHTEDDPRFDAGVDTASDGVARPFMCVPLKLRDKVVAVLRIFFVPEPVPDLATGHEPDHAPSLVLDGGVSARTGEVLAAAFSAALRNVLLYRSLLQSIEEVAQARREARAKS